MKSYDGGRSIIDRLLELGVDTVFGIISYHTTPLFDALYDYQDRIRIISARHEHAAALMADGYARVSGRPGVVITSTGPGAANAVGGLGEAWSASTPVLHITTTCPEKVYGRGLGTAHETKDQLGLLERAGKWAIHAGSAAEIERAFDQVSLALGGGRPGPVTLEVAMDALRETPMPGLLEKRTDREHTPAVETRTFDEESIARAAALLLSAEHGAIIAGQGVQRANAYSELKMVAERLGWPIFTTLAGKDAIEDTHPLAMGPLDQGGSITGLARIARAVFNDAREHPGNAALSTADAVLVVGSSLGYARTRQRNLRLPEKLVHIDSDPTAPGRVYPARVPLIGDAAEVLRRLHAHMGEPSTRLASSVREAQIADLKARVRGFIEACLPGQCHTMQAIHDALPAETVFVCDTAVAVFQGSHFCLPIRSPRSYLGSRWSSVGFAASAAIGAKVALPRRPVVCLTGDGGFQYHVQELATCAQYDISPVFVVFDDGAWGSLQQYQRQERHGRTVGVELRNPDFVELAQAFGVQGARAASRSELAYHLKRAVSSAQPTVIVVPIPEGFSAFE